MLVSFGFNKRSAPSSAKKVFDIRDLSHDTKSKWWVARRQEIRDYVKQHPKLTVAIGCEEGVHRSKVMVDQIAQELRISKFHL